MSDVDALADRTAWPELAALLAGWLPAQRWFQGKARRLTEVAVDDVAVLPGTPPVAVVFVRVVYRRGLLERYQVPLVSGHGLGAVGAVPVAEALSALGGARTVALHTLDGAAVETVSGATIHGAPVGDPPHLPHGTRPRPPQPPRR